MLRIRLTRVGKKNQPHFRVVIAEHRLAVKGRYLEILGHYDPRSKEISLNKEKIEDWIKKGAQPSVTVNNLLVKEGILSKKELIKVTVTKKKKEEEEKPSSAKAPEGGEAKEEKGEEDKKDVARDKVKVKKEDKPTTKGGTPKPPEPSESSSSSKSPKSS